MRGGVVRWQDIKDWQPVAGETYTCACGCGEIIQYSGIGRPQKFVNETHRKRAYRASKKADVSN